MATGAGHSVLNTAKGNLSNNFITIIGATGNDETQPFFQPIAFKLGKQGMTPQVLYLLNLLKALLG